MVAFWIVLQLRVVPSLRHLIPQDQLLLQAVRGPNLSLPAVRKAVYLGMPQEASLEPQMLSLSVARTANGWAHCSVDCAVIRSVRTEDVASVAEAQIRDVVALTAMQASHAHRI